MELEPSELFEQHSGGEFLNRLEETGEILDNWIEQRITDGLEIIRLVNVVHLYEGNSGIIFNNLPCEFVIMKANKLKLSQQFEILVFLHNFGCNVGFFLISCLQA